MLKESACFPPGTTKGLFEFITKLIEKNTETANMVHKFRTWFDIED